MANQSKIEFEVGYKVNQQDVNKVKQSLQSIQQMTDKDLKLFNATATTQDLEKVKTVAGQVGTALTNAYNPKLGTINISKFNKELSSSHLNVKSIYQEFSKVGSAGANAFRDLTTQILTTNLQLKETHSFLNNMATTMGNTIKWGIASSAMNNFTGAVQQAYGYVQHLDTSLNDIRIVTGKSADEMQRFAEIANNSAKNLGKSTTDYTEAALIYYQQGLSDSEAQARADITLKAANVTGQSAAAVSKELTSVWNGYKVTAEQAELYVDKLANVAAHSASNLQELATGMSKVASAANAMGVDIDQLNAQMSTIISVTRQAPESIGAALKTIYARMSDIKAGTDAEVDLGNYTKKMAAMGVNVLDAKNEIRDMGEVIEEVGGKWATMSREQQMALAQTMAGTRQYNNLLALFDNWDKYTNAIETSRNATGTLQKQQDIYMESTKAHLQQLKTAWEDVYDSLIDTSTINEAVDGFTSFINFSAKFIDNFDGLEGILSGIIPLMLNLFSGQIADGISTSVTNLQNYLYNLDQVNGTLETMRQYKDTAFSDASLQDLVNTATAIEPIYRSLSTEEKNAYNELVKEKAAILEQKDAWENSAKSASDYIQKVTGIKIDVKSAGVDELKEAWSRVKSNLIDDIQPALKEFKTNIEDLNKMDKIITSEDVTKANQYIEQIWDSLDDILENTQNNTYLQNLGFTPEQIKELQSQAQVVKESLQNATPDDETAQKAISKLYGSYKNYLEKIVNETNKTKDTVGKAINHESEKIEKNLDDIDQRAKLLADNFSLKHFTESLVKTTAATGQLAFGIQRLQGLKRIWDDDTLSPFEKFLQITTTLSFAIPSLVNGISSLAQNSILISKILNPEETKTTENIEQNAQQQERLAGLELELTEEQKINRAKEERVLLVEAQKDKESEELIALEAQIKALEVQIKKEKELIHYKEQTKKLSEEQGIKATTADGKNLGRSIGGNKSQLVQDEKQLAVLKEKEKALKANQKATQQLNTAEKIENATTKAGTVAKEADTVEELENVGANKLGEAEDKKRLLGKKGLIGALITHTIAVIADTAAEIMHNAILLAIVAAIIILTSAYAILESKRKEQIKVAETETESAKELLERSQKLNEQKQEEKKNIDALVTAYQSLAKQYDNNEITLSELRDKTFDLCNEYGRQDLALQALVTDYENLNNLMAAAQNTANDIAIESEQDVQHYALNSIIKSGRQSSQENTGVAHFGDQRDLTVDHGLGFIEKREEIFLNEFAQLTGSTVSQSGAYRELDIDEATMAKNWDKISDLMTWYSDLAGHNIYKDIDNYLKAVTDGVEAYNTSVTHEMSIQVDKLLNNFKSKNFGSYTAFAKELEQNLQTLADSYGYTAEELENIRADFIKKYGTDVGSTRLAAQDSIIHRGIELSQSDIDKISSLTDAQLASISSNLDSILLDVQLSKESVADAIDDWIVLTEAENPISKSKNAKLLLSTILDTGSINENVINSFFAIDPKEVEKFVQMTQEEFNKLEPVLQLDYIQKYYETLINEIEGSSDNYIKTMEKIRQKIEQKSLDNQIDAYFQKIKTLNYQQSFNYAINHTVDIPATEEEQKQLFVKLFSSDDNKLNGTEQHLKRELSLDKNLFGDIESAKMLEERLKTQKVITATGQKSLEIENKIKNIVQETAKYNYEIYKTKTKMAAESVNQLSSDLELATKLNKDAQDGMLSAKDLQNITELREKYGDAVYYEAGVLKISTARMKENTLASVENSKTEAEKAKGKIANAFVTLGIIESENAETQALIDNAKAWLANSTAVSVSGKEAAIELQEKQKQVRKWIEELEKIQFNDEFLQQLEESIKNMGTTIEKTKNAMDNDPYYLINKELEVLATNLSKVQKEADKLSGPRLIDNLNKQKDLLNQQVELQKKKLEIAKQEAATAAVTLKGAGADIDEETGFIKNYETVVAAINNATDEQKEVLKKALSTYEDASKQISTIADSINETADKLMEIDEKIKKIRYDAVDAKYDENNHRVQQIEKELDQIEKRLEDETDPVKRAEMYEKQKSLKEEKGRLLDNNVENREERIKMLIEDNPWFAQFSSRSEYLEAEAKSWEMLTEAMGGTADGYKEVLKEANKYMKESNVNLFNRPQVSAAKTHAAGYKDFSDKDTATTFTTLQFVKNDKGQMVPLHVTPILPDGRVLSKEELAKWIDENFYGKSNEEIMKADKEGGNPIILKPEFELDLEKFNVTAEEYEAYINNTLDKADWSEGLQKLDEYFTTYDENLHKNQEILMNWIQTLEKSGKYSKEEIETFKAIMEAFSMGSMSGEEFTKALEKVNDELVDGKYKAEDYKDAMNSGDLWKDFDKTKDIQTKIAGVTRELARVKKAQSGLEGTKLINNLKQQIEILKRQITLEKQKLKILIEQLKIKKQEAAVDISNKLGGQVSLKFDKYGMVSNYTEVMEAAGQLADENDYKKIENWLTTINELATSVLDQEDNIKDLEYAIKDAEDNIKKEALKKAEETGKDVQAELQKWFNLKVDVELDIADATRRLNTLKKKIDGLKDTDILGNAKLNLENYKTYFQGMPGSYFGGADMGGIAGLTSHVNAIASEIGIMQSGGTSSLYGDDQHQAFEDLKNYRDQLMSQLESVEDLKKQIEDSYMQMIDKISSQFDRIANQYKQIDTLIDHNINLIKLLRGEEAYDAIDKWYEQKEQNNIAAINSAKKELDARQKLLEEARARGNEEEIKKAEDAIIAAQNNINQLSEKAIQDAVNRYSNAIKKIYKEAKEKMGLTDSVKEEWEWEKRQMDKYLDDINKSYQIGTFKNKGTKYLNETSSLKAQQEIKKVMDEQTKILEEQSDLRQSDVDRANKVLEIKMKEIALEEAQNNKTTMRMRRDSQGNYRYEYVADNNDVSDKMQELADARNDLYNFDRNRARETYEEGLNLLEEYMNKSEEIRQKLGAGLISEEEAQKELDALNNRYLPELKKIDDQRILEREQLYNSGAESYKTFSDSLMGATEEQARKFIEEQNPMLTGSIDSLISKFGGNDENSLKSVVKDVTDQAQKEYNDLQTTIDNVTDAAGIDIENLMNGTDPALQQTQDFISLNEDLLQSYYKELDGIRAVIDELARLEDQYKTLKQAAIEALDEIRKLREEEEAAKEEKTESSSNSGTGASSGNNRSSSSLSDTTSGTITVKKIKNVTGWSPNAFEKVSSNPDWLTPSNIGSTLRDAGMKQGDEKTFKVTIHGRSIWSATSMKTGGYTGDWNSNEGRLAVLHEKELVLNKEDTENMLTAISMVRDMAHMIQELRLEMINQEIEAFRSNFTEPAMEQQQIEQNVHITATFPNVQSSNEIEEALSNLVNRSSQYLAKSKR